MNLDISPKVASLAVALAMNSLIFGSVAYVFHAETAPAAAPKSPATRVVATAPKAALSAPHGRI